MQPDILITCVFLLVASVLEASSPSGNTLDEEVRASLDSSSGRSLSRKRRYLLFPVGSSLQLGSYVLVYDTTFPILIQGEPQAPFVFGSTAALAWQLPYELLGPLKLKLEQKGKLRRVDKPGWKLGGNDKNDKKQNEVWPTNYKATHLLPEYMHYFKPVRYGSHAYQNSAAYRQAQRRKYSYHQRVSYGNRNNYYVTNGYRRPVTTYVNPYFNEVHRRTRRQLFVKVEKFLTVQRKDGRACLLKAVCEVSQASEVGKGTFIEEIIKAIFRVHPHLTGKEHDVYDSAAMKRHNCTEMYPSCNHSLWDFF